MASDMLVAIIALAFAGPPSLPPDLEQPEQPSSEGAEAAPEEPGEIEEPASEIEEPASEIEEPASETFGEDQAIPVTPAPAPESSPAAPSTPAVQQPVAKPTSSTVPPPVVQPQPPSAPAPEPQAEPEAQAEPEESEEPESYRKLGGIRLFRFGVAAKIGYTHGTSAKNGLYDRDKSIQDSVDNMMVTTSGAGDLGKTGFGGFQYGFIVDAEIVGVNVWLDFHKFFNPGGMWSLLLGYDHEFGFGKRLRLDVGVGGGLNHVFLGKALADLYYDKDNPEAVNIGTLGVEGRAMVDLHIKLVGPLFTGPYAMVGYHYLWSANAAEVTAEKGLHYSAGWSLRLDFAAPKLLGGRAKK
jgi:hypothetical protein